MERSLFNLFCTAMGCFSLSVLGILMSLYNFLCILGEYEISSTRVVVTVLILICYYVTINIMLSKEVVFDWYCKIGESSVFVSLVKVLLSYVVGVIVPVLLIYQILLDINSLDYFVSSTKELVRPYIKNIK